MTDERCIVPNCNSGHVLGDKPIAFFNIPEDGELRRKWTEAISRTGVSLCTTDVVCEKHFYEYDLIRHYVVKDAAGNVVEKVAYDHPRLVDTAVPSIFPGYELRPNEYQVDNNPQSASQIASDAMYNYMLMDTASDVAHLITAGVDTVGKVAHHTQSHDGNDRTKPEVVSQVVENSSAPESQPLVSGVETSHDVSYTANSDISGDGVNQATKSLNVFQSEDSPITAEPLPIISQPKSTFVSSDNNANDAGGTHGDDECCDCDDGCCDCGDDCGDCCSDGDACVVS